MVFVWSKDARKCEHMEEPSGLLLDDTAMRGTFFTTRQKQNVTILWRRPRRHDEPHGVSVNYQMTNYISRKTWRWFITTKIDKNSSGTIWRWCSAIVDTTWVWCHFRHKPDTTRHWYEGDIITTRQKHKLTVTLLRHVVFLSCRHSCLRYIRSGRSIQWDLHSVCLQDTDILAGMGSLTIPPSLRPYRCVDQSSLCISRYKLCLYNYPAYTLLAVSLSFATVHRSCHCFGNLIRSFLLGVMSVRYLLPILVFTHL